MKASGTKKKPRNKDLGILLPYLKGCSLRLTTICFTVVRFLGPIISPFFPKSGSLENY
jgi:hypothetical protein